jgi:5-methylthioribose kinase
MRQRGCESLAEGEQWIGQRRSAHHEDGLTADRLRRYAETLLHDRAIMIEEIGNGNLNRVFRIGSGNRTIIVKYAPPFVSTLGAVSPLSTVRNAIEAAAYQLHRKAAPGVLPAVLGQSRNHSMLALEDLADMRDWRSILLEGEPDPAVADAVGTYLGQIAARTGALCLSTQRANRLKHRFTNSAMQRFTEREVFVTPYRSDEVSNWPGELSDVAERIRRDSRAISQTNRARWLFRTSAEAILHGDLHTGSVMVGAATRPRVIDLEFAFPGPIAFDAGTFTAHLLLARIRRAVLGRDTGSSDESAGAFWDAFVTSLRSSASEWIGDSFVRDLLDHSRLFAATEILRRVGGRFHTEDFTSLAAGRQADAYRHAIDSWAALIGVGGLTSFGQLWGSAVEPRKEYR